MHRKRLHGDIALGVILVRMDCRSATNCLVCARSGANYMRLLVM